VPLDPRLDLASIEKAVRAEQQRDPNGTDVSNKGGWQSKMDLDERDEFKMLVEYLRFHANQSCKDWGLDFRGHPAVLNSLWANVNGPKDYNQTHHHWGFPFPNFNVLSGAFYVRCNKDTGSIRFVDERPSTKFVTCYSLPALGPASHLLGEYFTATPKQGDLLLFPAWLDHKVTPNESDQERISMSFNISIPKEIILGDK
jgi:uncharacterized protein (TIGR02466 family)